MIFEFNGYAIHYMEMDRKPGTISINSPQSLVRMRVCFPRQTALSDHLGFGSTIQYNTIQPNTI